jgi:ABC-type antimicrobial peptide transport system permease subunit
MKRYFYCSEEIIDVNLMLFLLAIAVVVTGILPGITVCIVVAMIITKED